MSILKERKDLTKENPFIYQNIVLTKTSTKLSNYSPLLNDNKMNKQLDYISEMPLDSDDRYITPQKMEMKASNVYTLKEIKPIITKLNKEPKTFKLISKIKRIKITEKKPEDDYLRNSSKYPTNSLLLNSSPKNNNINNSRNKTQIKMNDNFIKIPMNNTSPLDKNIKSTKQKKNNAFTEVEEKKEKPNNQIEIIVNNKIKITNKNEAEKNKEKMKLESIKGKIVKKEKDKKRLENVKKIIVEQKNKNIEVIQKEINKSNKIKENKNHRKEPMDTVNKENIIKKDLIDNNINKSIELNKIIKKDITKKIMIENSETINENKIKQPKTKMAVKSILNQINNNSEINYNNKGFNQNKINISFNKNIKVYNIIFDEIKNNINVEKLTNKNIKKEEKNVLKKSKEEKKDSNNKPDLNIDTNKQKRIKYNKEHKNVEVDNNIISIKSEVLKSKRNKGKNLSNSSIPTEINNKNQLSPRYEKKNKIIISKNKIEKNQKKEIKLSKENKKNKKDIIKAKKKPYEINFNFIKEVSKRYEDSPPKEIRKSNSGIISKNKKNFIFNKIISMIENKKNIISKYINYPLQLTKREEFCFNPNDFKYLYVLGNGEYGKIYLVQWETNDNQFYAMKYEKFKSLEEAQKNQNIIRIIKNFLDKTKSDGIIKIYGDICLKVKDLYHYYTLMEKAERDLEQECIIRSKNLQYYTEKNLINILCQITTTCASLQRHNICHGDIKPQNILILNGRYKLTDFGEVKILDNEGYIEQDIGGTELYMSPKIFFSMKKNEKSVVHNAYKSDVFSLSFCMLLMASFNYDILVQIREQVDMEKIKFIVNQFLSRRYSQNLLSVLIWMLEVDENKRPNFIQLESKLLKTKK